MPSHCFIINEGFLVFGSSKCDKLPEKRHICPSCEYILGQKSTRNKVAGTNWLKH